MTPTENPSDLAATATGLSRRWDAQQAAYIRHRDERFATIGRTVAAATAGTERPRVLDLAGGTGSLGRAVLEHVPGAHVVVADKDPVLVAIAADIAAADPRLEAAELDLDDPSWTRHPAIAAAPFDAVVSSTALHWLRPASLAGVYGALTGIVRQGGIVLNGDHLLFDPRIRPFASAVAADDAAAVYAQRIADGADTWDAWWADAEAAYPAAAERRARVWGDDLHTAPPTVTLGFHIEALRGAGFSEAGTIWQYFDDYVVYGVRG